VKTFQELQAQPESIEKPRPFEVDDLAYIQYSSGSPSSPKGVLITQKAIVANTRGILRDGLKITNDDRAFSWLPLYHDMGLVGFCLSPMMGQVTVDYMSTPSFARRPALWLKLMSDNRSTIAYSPSFGFDLAARRINGEAATLDLSAWRVAGIGGDMVRGDNGQDLTDREIGHILIKGPSLMAGYFENSEATQAVMSADGYMDTGDMGYWLDGEIVITGRAKDLILHNGRNIWPQDIEWA